MEFLFKHYPLASTGAAALIGVAIGYVEWRLTRDPLLYMSSWLISVFMAAGFVFIACGLGMLGAILAVATFVAGLVMLVFIYRSLRKRLVT